MSLTYPEVGASRGGALPAGYHHLDYRVAVGTGAEAFTRAGTAVMSFAMHRKAGVRIQTTAPAASPGQVVVVWLGVGPLRITAPCEVTWSVRDDREIGFGYGTLPGHPERGEEMFLVTRAANDTVWFSVRAFSRPARWFTRIGGPFVSLVQMAYAKRLGRVLRRIASG